MGQKRISLKSMLISSHKLNFVHIPKAAGSSIGKLLESGINLTKKDLFVQDNFTKYAELQ